MKFFVIIVGAVYATTATAWSIDWYYTDGKQVASHGSGTNSDCINLDVANVNLNQYVVNFDTTLRRDPNRVRLWTGKGCSGTKTWDSGKKGLNDLVPNRIVKSYIIDHD